MSSRRTRSLVYCTLLLSAVASGCHKHRHYGGGSRGPEVIYEREPNNGVDNPDFIGTFGPGDAVDIRGHIQAFGPDEFDGFAFVSDRPVEVEFLLNAHDPFADLDLFVYDPYLDQVVAVYDSPHDPERGSFFVLDPNVEFHMVVEAYNQSSNYTLEVRGYFANLALGEGGSDGQASLSRVRASEGAAAGATPIEGSKVNPDGYRGRADAPERVEPRLEGLRGVLLERDSGGVWRERSLEGVVVR